MANSSSKRTLDLKSIEHAYDHLEYNAGISQNTHPCQIGGRASLFGLVAPLVPQAKILEIGCAMGQNLISIATSMPEAICIGVDISPKQIEHARKEAQALQLTNIVFIEANIMDLVGELGTFDYIICHGFYSWVPDDIRQNLFSVLHQFLSPLGLLYISYNTLPGWSESHMIRSLVQSISPGLNWHADQIPMIDQWITSLPASSIKSRYENLWFNHFRNQPEFYKRHGIFAEFNTPRLISELVAEAQEHGLHYITDSSLKRDFPIHKYLDVSTQSKHLARIDRIQLLDFAQYTTFRSSIFSKQAPYYGGNELNLTSLPRLSVISKLIEVDPHSSNQNHEDYPSSMARYFQNRDQSLTRPICLDMPDTIDIMTHANLSWPHPLLLKDYLQTLADDTTKGRVMSQLITLLIHDYVDLYIDVPSAGTSHKLEITDKLYCPQLSNYNLHYMRHEQKHLTIQGLHHPTHAIRDHPWFPFADLFDGKHTCDTLLNEVKNHRHYQQSTLASMNESEQKKSLKNGLVLFRRQGFL